jgi:predicted ABC-type ATPase
VSKPLLVMFAGPNGSGKSTITPSFQAQPDFPSNYINPDEIALSLGGNIMERAYEASAIAANYRDECIRTLFL